MIRGLFVILLLAFINGCASNRDIASLHELPLPHSGAGDCCWQLLQSLSIHNSDHSASPNNHNNNKKAQTLELQAVLLHQKKTLSIILIDALGRRVVTIDDKNGDISVIKNKSVMADIPARLLIAAVYLAYWPEQSWKDSLNDSQWQMTQHDHKNNGQLSRTLHHKNIAIVSINNVQPLGPRLNQTAALHHHLLPFDATIKTHQRQNLQEQTP